MGSTCHLLVTTRNRSQEHEGHGTEEAGPSDEASRGVRCESFTWEEAVCGAGGFNDEA